MSTNTKCLVESQTGAGGRTRPALPNPLVDRQRKTWKGNPQLRRVVHPLPLHPLPELLQLRLTHILRNEASPPPGQSLQAVGRKTPLRFSDIPHKRSNAEETEPGGEGERPPAGLGPPGLRLRRCHLPTGRTVKGRKRRPGEHPRRLAQSHRLGDAVLKPP